MKFSEVTFEGQRYASTGALARALGLKPGIVWLRWNHGIRDSRLPLPCNLNSFRHTNKIKPRPASTPRVPMYVRTFMNGWREWVV